ncbi:MAG: YfhO family protein [Lachnospiraceae bacterium]|nr:YfhO family protein [Lachnospiraceae bacterium]
MFDLIKKLLKNDKIRYVIAGGLTTFVNMLVFFSLRILTDINRNVCNIIAIIMAIIFAYFINKYFVFRSKTKNISEAIREAGAFFVARLISMAVEVLGLVILCDSFRIKEWIAKLFIIQIIVLVLNYIFSKIFVFNKERKSIKNWLLDNYCYYIPFFIVMVIMTVVFVAQKIAPFGKNTITIIDSLHQYVPFYAEYMDKLKAEGSLFYTWNIALGSNFMSLSSYYLSSPFNYLLLLFDKEHIVAGACIIIALKVSLSGTAMAYYLAHKNSSKKVDKSFSIIAVSVCYALSNYVVGYNWCTMWMDVIMIFPLIMLGFEKLMRKNDPRLYTLTMFYALYCNYYIGFIVCVFLVLWFLTYNHKNIKKFFVDGIRFAIYSVISGGMAAFLLIPAYFGIMSTAAGDMKLPKWEWYGSIFNLLKQQFFLTMPITNQTFDGGVNLYCGMLAVFTAFLYIFTGKINVWEKIKNILLLAILAVSFNSTTLNYIWHGFHNQYGIPNRFSFLFIFILLVMTYETIRRARGIHVIFIVGAFLISIAYMVLCSMEADEHLTKKVLTASIIMLSLYTIIFLMYSLNAYKKFVFQIIISSVCVVEMSISSLLGFFYNGYSDYSEKYKTTKAVTKANERIAEIAEDENAGFYRSELMKSTVLDEVTWHNMPSVGTFCSTVLGDVTHTMGKLGFYTGANEFLYMGASPFTNSIFNVRYLLWRDGNLDNFDYNYLETVDGVKLYENPYPLAIGFSVSEKVKEWNPDAGYPFSNINNLAYYMTGYSSFMNVTDVTFSASSKTGDVKVNDKKITLEPREAGDLDFTASFVVEEAGDYYINCRGNSVTKIRFYINGKEYAYDRYQIQIFHLGYLETGDVVAIEYNYNNQGTEQKTATIETAKFDTGNYINVYDRLNLNKLDVTEYDDGYIYGNINIPTNDTLFTSIPYDRGWTVKVDGKKTEYYKTLGAFIGVDMEPGEHDIEFKYIPCGLYIGMLISLTSWLLFVALVMYNSNKKSSKKLVKNDNDKIDLSENI